VFAFGEWWTEKYIADRSRIAGTAIEIAIVLVATLLFRPIHQRVENAIEAAFTRRRREAREALNRLRKELTSFNDAQQVLRRVIEAVDHHMDADGCAVYLRREMYGAEASSFDFPLEKIEPDDALAIRLRSTAAPADPRALHSLAAGAIAFPMMAGGELVGFLTVMPKRNEYEPDDRQTLAALTEAVGLALIVLDPHLRTQSVTLLANNLPVRLTPLIGLDAELAEIKSLFEQTRLVTLTGAGGIGKTRMALQVASDMLRGFGDGAWFVDLAPFDDPLLVPSAIADVFNVADDGGTRSLIDRVRATLKAKQLLMVLDNCEHVIRAACDSADHLLQACPGIHILATSREPLGIAGEEAYGMPTLPVPPEDEKLNAESALQYGAVALFVARAHTAHRTFALTDENAGIVSDIVRRLDGIALAIELAASRTKALSLKQLDERLDECLKLLSSGSRTAQPRHQTLRALIAWSYDLLSAPEQSLVRQSAIFRGSFTLEAAGEICIDERVPDWDVLDLLAALADKSLVVVESEGEEPRYRLLESTRQFAAEKLDEEGARGAVAARHSSHFAAVAQRAADAYWQTDSDSWKAGVRRDLENYRAAISWGLAGSDAAAATTIISSLRSWWFQAARGEGRALLARAEAELTADAPARVRGSLALAIALLGSSDAHAAEPASEAARALAGIDELGRIEALADQALAFGRAGRVTESVALFEEALAAARTARTPRLLGWVLSQAAYWVGASGDRAKARAYFGEAAALLRACNDRRQLAILQSNRAEFLFAENDAEAALESARESEGILRERREESNLSLVLQNAAGYLLALGRFDEAGSAAAESLELALRTGDAHRINVGISHLAQLAAETGEPKRAALLLGFSDAGYVRTGSAREPTERRGYERACELIRDRLPDDTISALMAQGAAMEPDAAAAEASSIRRLSAEQASVNEAAIG
jgi:predicted ATPase